MKLDILYEVDAPKPWGAAHPKGQRDREQRAYAEAIEQVLGEPEVDAAVDAVGFEARGHGRTRGRLPRRCSTTS